jgi:outer membrane protein TolC
MEHEEEPVPSKSRLLDQGSVTGYTGGVGLEQPLTQLFRIHQANVAAKEDALVAETQLDQTQDAIALEVRQLYCNILIKDRKLEASQAQLAAAEVKDEESRSDMVKRQQMGRSRRGAHLLLQIRTRGLNDEWENTFRRRYPAFRPIVDREIRAAG